MSGMGLVHRKSLSLLRTVAHIDQTYYPERLGRVCVYTGYVLVLSFLQLFFINVPRCVRCSYPTVSHVTALDYSTSYGKLPRLGWILSLLINLYYYHPTS